MNILVTGCNTGIGLETCRALLKQENVKTLFVSCRTTVKAEEVKEIILISFLLIIDIKDN